MPYEINGIQLQDDEYLAKISTSDGDVRKIEKKGNNIPKGKHVHNRGAKFTKVYEVVDRYLLDELSDTEYRVVSLMKLMSEPSTNSLKPLSNETSQRELSQEFRISRQMVSKIFKKLEALGVYGEFSITNTYGVRDKYWILNPYISFKGKLISDEIVNLFYKTKIAKEFRMMSED